MKKTLIVACLILLVGACKKESNTYKITGTADKSDGKYAYCSYLAENGETAIDSIEIKDGKFIFEGEAKAPLLAVIKTASHQWHAFLEKGEITLIENGATGTLLNDAIMSFQQEIIAVKNEQQLLTSIQKHVKANKDNLASAYLVIFAKNIVGNSKALEMASLCSPEVQEQIWQYVPKEQFQDKAAMFTDIEVEYQGHIQKLSDYVGKGKYALIDFWASWCNPCREEIPHLQELYNRFKDQGLVVVGVATWDQPEDTERAIQELGITYPQIINAQKIGSDAYGFNSIPQILLINPDGTIAKTGLRGTELIQTVEKLFKQ